MKQQEIFRQVINKAHSFIFLLIAVIVVFSFATFLVQQSFAASNDPKFYFLEKPVTSVSLVGGKKIPVVTFKVGATSQNGQLWNASGSTRLIIEIKSSGGVGDQSYELPSGGTGSVSFSNLIPNRTYTIKASLLEITPVDGYVKRELPGDIGYFTAPDGDMPADTKLFSYDQKPEALIVTQDGVSSSIVKLRIISAVDETLSVVITPLQGGTIGQQVAFKKGVTTLVTFPSLIPNATYQVMIASGSQGNYQQVAALGSFNSVSAPLVYTPNQNQPQTPTPTPTDIGTTIPRATSTGSTAKLGTTCTDGKDNDGDGRIDYYGTATAEPDPSCYAIDAEEIADDVAKGSLVPCTDKCGFSDVFKLLNNVLKFIITTLLIPIFVIMIMYIGFKYLTARGNPGVHLKFKKMLWNMFLGVVIILSAWLIVRTILSTLGYADGLLFFQ